VNDKTEKDVPKWDWVIERSSCSYPKIFKDLMLQVAEDVKSRNSLRPQNSPYEFSTVENGNEFTVIVQARDVRKSVTFGLGEHSISVRGDQDNQMFEVTLTFAKDGKCRLNVRNEECDLWQVRRLALEDLFFTSY
jgi:hypothetical protein